MISEPQILNASKIHAFHVATCEAAWAHDPRAACIIGAGAYYNRCARASSPLLLSRILVLTLTCGLAGLLPTSFDRRYNLDERYILHGGPVIYAANYLTPKPYTKGELLNISYPMTQEMRCGDLVMKKDQPACPGGNLDAEIVFNKAFLRKLAAPFSVFSQKFNVPVWIDQVRLVASPDLALASVILINDTADAHAACLLLTYFLAPDRVVAQWGLHAAVGGGNAAVTAYITDALDIFEEGGFPWTQWIWRGPSSNCQTFNIVCQPVITPLRLTLTEFTLCFYS